MGGVPAILTATHDMDECVKVVRQHVMQPFPDPPKELAEHDYMTAWIEANKSSRMECNDGVEQWVANRAFPILDDAPAFFLLRRLDQASWFLQSLFNDDQKSPFMSLVPLDDLLRWSLTTWWESHGWHLALSEDEREMMDRLYPRQYY